MAKKATTTATAVGDPLGRVGLAARGAMYIVVAALATEVAVGRQGAHPDKEGALSAVARQPMGRLLVVVLAIGFLANALWRGVQAVLDPSHERGTDAGGLAKRAAVAARGLVYVGGFILAVPFATGARRSGGGGNKEQDLTARMLGWPAGRFLVAAIGLGFLAAAAANGRRAVTGGFRKKLDTKDMATWVQASVTWLGRVGMAARLVAWGLIGAFIVRAALHADPGQAVGLDGALRRLAHRPAGSFLLLLTAAGLFAFGLYSCCEARWREVDKG